eukprot:969943-Prorocentrum_minimum.AAC.1
MEGAKGARERYLASYGFRIRVKLAGLAEEGRGVQKIVFRILPPDQSFLTKILTKRILFGVHRTCDMCTCAKS